AAALVAVLSLVVGRAAAQGGASTLKVAFFNIQSGKGEPPLAGRPASFVDTANCTDQTKPLNGWGVGFVQPFLVTSLRNDPKVIALGLAEAWTCGSAENVRSLLGWRARSSTRNGLAMVARHGFAGAEEWLQLDTSRNLNPVDTMWVVRIPVCVNAACTQGINVFAAHWLATGTDPALIATILDGQGRDTVSFLQRSAGSGSHVRTGDLNAWEGAPTCGQIPLPQGLPRLRAAGYMDAWPSVHGTMAGFTGMTNRSGCGTPQGNVWKRIDYVWSSRGCLPLSMTRFGVVVPGEMAPSDHYGIIAEYPLPGAAPAPDAVRPVTTLIAPTQGSLHDSSMTIRATATDDIAVTRVEFLENGVVVHTMTTTPYEVTRDVSQRAAGSLTVQARAFDAAGNVGLSAQVQVQIQHASSAGSGEVVLHARQPTRRAGAWQAVADATAAGGSRMWQPDMGAAKLAAPLASPVHYLEMTFLAEAGRPYRLWLRGKAERDHWSNDSVFVQFTGSVNAAGQPVFRSGTTSATSVVLEECGGCGVSGWGWQDNGYGTGVAGPLIYFVPSGTQPSECRAGKTDSRSIRL
ncbi:MAG: Ig-like domain-containing protein, partial [Vicinamibacterales bacterium]